MQLYRYRNGEGTNNATDTGNASQNGRKKGSHLSRNERHPSKNESHARQEAGSHSQPRWTPD
jgi:hypothetical protein